MGTSGSEIKAQYANCHIRPIWLLSSIPTVVAMNAAEEPGTLVYNVYFNRDETLFTYLETYSDSETGLFHAGRFAEGEYVGQILERTDGGRLCFYGDVSIEFKAWAIDNGFEIEFFTRIDGFVR